MEHLQQTVYLTATVLFVLQVEYFLAIFYLAVSVILNSKTSLNVLTSQLRFVTFAWLLKSRKHVRAE